MASSGLGRPRQELRTSPSREGSLKQGNTVTVNTPITAQNACEVFEYLPAHKVLVCRAHCYAIRDLDEHLKRLHKTAAPERRAIVSHFKDYERVAPAQVPLPPPLEAPFDCLGAPQRAYICEEPECEVLSVSRDGIRKHCNNKHDWKSTPDQRTYWHEAWVQTFFNAAGLQRYFTVDYENELSPRKRGGRHVILNTDSGFDDILAEWDEQDEKHRESLAIADSEVAKTDHSGWGNKSGWAGHLANSNLRHLSLASRLPDKGEAMLQQAVQINKALIESCVAGLGTLDAEIRRWLRSAKLSEPDQRPLARLQEPESLQTYIRYMSRLLCYSLRVLQSEQRGDGEREGSSRSDSDDSDGSDGSNNRSSTPAAVDVLKDARRLYRWAGEQRPRLEAVQRSITFSWDERAQQLALLGWYESLIFQKVRGQPFQSVLLHFLAVLGINEDTFRLRQANDFSYMLAGVVYCTRVLAVEILLPSSEREEQGEADDRRFRTWRDDYLADGTFSVMSKMLSLLAYGKHIALNHSNAGTTSMSPDRQTLYYRGQLINLPLFGRVVRDVVTAAEDILWAELLRTSRSERFALPLEQLRDDVTFTKRGVSFVTHPANGLSNTRVWMLERAGRTLLRGKTWRTAAVQAYLRQVDRFRELLLFCVHVTGGQPARGTEITSLRFRNGFMQDRNVFVMHGQLVVVTRYHKSQSQFDRPKVIPRFLPWRVGQLLAVYLAYVQPFQEFLAGRVSRLARSDYIWSNAFGPWGTERLTKILGQEAAKGLGVRLTTLDYRHVAIALGREVVGEQFARGHIEQSDDIEAAEVDEGEDGLEMSAGRGGEVGANRYGVSLDVIKHLSSRSIDTFRPLSDAWQRFLELSSRHPGGGKGLGVEMESPGMPSRGQKRRAPGWGSSSSVGSGRPAKGAHLSADVSQGHSIGPHLHGFPPGPISHPMWQTTPQPARPPLLPPDDWSTPSSIGLGVTPLESSPLWGRSHQLPRPVAGPAAVDAGDIERAMQRALGQADVAFRSAAQQEALETIMRKDDFAPLIVVLPTGGGKSLLFLAPACLPDPGVTVVVVPYRALLNRLLATAQAAGIDSFEWKHGEVNPAALVFVSADIVMPFLSYARVMENKGLLRRVFVDESHLTFTASNWRAKLTTVRQVRGLRAPTIMLTATLPPALEFELEDSMAAPFARYIRTATTRVRTRYTVDECPAGQGRERVLQLCGRMRQHLGSRKGVVYSRSRAACESLAGELGCAYYHAGQVDNQEQLDRWLAQGGLIVATSALGTGVDFPGIEFILHTDVPYGMIDFAQESGRGGRAGEDVDSVIVVEAGRVEQLAELTRGYGIDQQAMDEFITTRGCRRLVLSRYLDGSETCCDTDQGLARCDRCGGGQTELEWRVRRAAEEREGVESMLDRLRTGCARCWAQFGGREEGWMHAAGRCPRATGDQDRRRIRFAVESHSCFRCGLGQKLCRTGQDESADCQWPGVMSGFAVGFWGSGERDAVLSEVGAQPDAGEEGYWEWMGQQHPRRIWDEVMSNAIAVFVRSVVRAESGAVVNAEAVRASPGTVVVEDDSEEEMPVRDGRRRVEQRVVREASEETSQEASEEASQEASEEASLSKKVESTA
ncbi:hypothetical protein KC328_g17564, partial [Hortaea werneckii]